jgi:predicted HD phosphohydrolase
MKRLWHKGAGREQIRGSVIVSEPYSTADVVQREHALQGESRQREECLGDMDSELESI